MRAAEGVDPGRHVDTWAATASWRDRRVVDGLSMRADEDVDRAQPEQRLQWL